MAVTPSTMVALGTEAPDFSLTNIDGTTVSRSDFEGMPLLVVFLCNHCPYVIHVQHAFARFAREYQERGLAIVGINSNDVENYPDDSPEKMQERAAEVGFSFPYLFDETQGVARAFEAACTPDFFLYDSDHRLVYRGQFDETRPDKGTATGKDLRAAVDALLAGKPIAGEQIPSAGCNIKWKT